MKICLRNILVAINNSKKDQIDIVPGDVFDIYPYRKIISIEDFSISTFVCITAFDIISIFDLYFYF